MSNIDWSQLVTKAMKDSAAAAQLLAAMKADMASRNTAAATQIARIQDRVDTLGYGVDSGEATAEDESELAALTVNLKAWKAYKFALGKVAAQTTWPTAPVWPVIPANPLIAADPESVSPETA
ncbi:phage tail protein [Pseudomonas sp. NA-150]|uniref:phage tail protein n=1 Tax=Pseudomonas sp. NA-150 TaxID=3367525 RepID=UPI0037C98233